MEEFDKEQFLEELRNQVVKVQDPLFPALRRQANIQGGVLLIYKALMNVAVLLLVFGVSLYQTIAQLAAGSFQAASDVMLGVQAITDAVADATGWGYLLAAASGWAILRLWKKRTYFRETIYKPGKPMTVATFFALVAVMFGVQIPAQLWSMGLEWACNQFGYSLDTVLQSSGMDMDRLSIWLYVSLAAPVTEELLFRGLLLRGLEDYGKPFAVMVSAALFGLYHGSPIQTPFAFMVGLVLGYVAVEYNIIWAMVLHMMNNLLLSDTFPRLLSGLPYQVGDTILWIFLGLCCLIGVVILILKWRELRTWRCAAPTETWHRRAYWRAPCVVIVTIWCLVDLCLYFVLMCI